MITMMEEDWDGSKYASLPSGDDYRILGDGCMDWARGTRGAVLSEDNRRMRFRVRRLLQEAHDVGSISPGADDIPVPMVRYLTDDDGRTREFDYVDYMIDDPSWLDSASPVLCFAEGAMMTTIPWDTGGDDGAEPRHVLTSGRMRSGLCMNPVFMYYDFITLTDDPERAIARLGFSHAMRLSAISRARGGGMAALGVTRRRLFSMAMEHADTGTFLLLAAASTGPLPGMLKEYGGLPCGFVAESMKAMRTAGRRA